MKLVEIKKLKESVIFKKIIIELNIKGLDKIYERKTTSIDYIDIIISITNFLEVNKNVFKKLNKDNYENLFLIVLVEILEEINIETDEEQLDKIMILLKNSLLVRKATNFMVEKVKIIISKIDYFFCRRSNTKNNDTVDTVHTIIKTIQK